MIEKEYDSWKSINEGIVISSLMFFSWIAFMALILYLEFGIPRPIDYMVFILIGIGELVIVITGIGGVMELYHIKYPKLLTRSESILIGAQP